MQVRVHKNPNRDQGLGIEFPYNEQWVRAIKLCLGTSWNKSHGMWLTDGPEVLLDMQRFGIRIEWMSASAREICEGFRQQLWDVMDARAEDIDAEYAYQRQGTAVLAAMPNIILGDDMGLGKSKQSLDAAVSINASSILVLCPKTLCYNWAAEVEKWHPELNWGVVPDNVRSGRRKGQKVIGRKEFWEAPPQVVIANYEKIRLGDWPFNIDWDVVILDEATKLKNRETSLYSLTRQLLKRVACAWALTGTPLEIRVLELYNILGLLRPTVLGNFIRFKAQHLVTDWGGNVIGVQNLDLLRERIAPFMLRRTKSEVLKQLPPKIYNNVYVKLTPQESAAYEAMTSEFNNWLNEHGVSGAGDPLVQLLRMRQFCATPMIFTDELGRGSKFELLEEIIEQYPGRIVIFCFFKEVVHKLREWLRADPEAVIHGDVPNEERVPRVTAFNEGKLGKIFLSTDAGGMGLNITGADMIIHYDQLWNPQRMHQREDRLHRIGQKNNVTVVNMMCLDTIDVGMYQLNEERQHLFEEVVDGAEEALLRKLDAPRLRRIVEGRLNKENDERDRYD